MTTTPSPTGSQPQRHSLLVRVTHWLTVIAFLALLLSGLEIVVSHPRFYFGETGTVMDKPAFTLPIPSSRDTVPTAYKYVLPDQNGWSRYLHFQAAWLLFFVALTYVLTSLRNGHLRRDLWPSPGQRGWRNYWAVLAKYLHRTPPTNADAHSYNAMQRAAYIFVLFVLFPLIIWTGLAMSPAFEGAVPWAVAILGGHQTARTLHFFLTWALVLFLIVHVTMVALAGFRNRMSAMITGHATPPDAPPKEIR